MIRKLKSGYRLYSRKKNPRTGKRRNLGTFKTLAAAQQHERRNDQQTAADSEEPGQDAGDKADDDEDDAHAHPSRGGGTKLSGEVYAAEGERRG